MLCGQNNSLPIPGLENMALPLTTTSIPDTTGLVRTGVVIHYVKPKKQGDAQEWCVRFGDDPRGVDEICKDLQSEEFVQEEEEAAASSISIEQLS
jgi:hypothetical protein